MTVCLICTHVLCTGVCRPIILSGHQHIKYGINISAHWPITGYKFDDRTGRRPTIIIGYFALTRVEPFNNLTVG